MKKGLRNIPRVLKINRIENRTISLLFNNGQSKLVDIKQFLEANGGLNSGSLGNKVIENDEVFNSAIIVENTLTWPGIGIYSKDFSGNDVFYAFDLDSLMLFESGVIDEATVIDIGIKIKQLRKELGLTQEQLAKRSGTTKHYISKIENNKSDIEIMTLKKIIEAGFDRRLSLSIE